MQKRFVSTSTHILDPANPSTPPIRPSPPPEPSSVIQNPDDKRSLFDRLAEVKAKKQEAFEEAYKFSSLIKRLDDSESDFIANLRTEQSKEEQEKKRVENEQVDAFKKAQSAIDVVRPSTQDIIPPPPPPAQNRRSSSGFKRVLVKRKSESEGGDNKRRRSSNPVEPTSTEKISSILSPKDSGIAEPLSYSPVPAAAKSVIASPVNAAAPKTSVSQGIAGFDHYSDSDEDSE